MGLPRRTVTTGLLEHNVLHAGWVAATDDGRHLIMMRGPDDSTYCLTVAGGASVYGGCSAVRVDVGSLDLDLTPEAAGLLGVGDHVRITWDPTTAPADLQHVVAQVLRGLAAEQ